MKTSDMFRLKLCYRFLSTKVVQDVIPLLVRIFTTEILHRSYRSIFKKNVNQFQDFLNTFKTFP